MVSGLYSSSPLLAGLIRFLTIFLGQPGSLINGTLSLHQLDCPHAYNELSYTLGTPKSQVSIYINNQLLHVGANLHAALTELRKGDEEIILWVDALRVNQTSIEEKSVHVPLMHHVYQYSGGCCLARQEVGGQRRSDGACASVKQLRIYG